MRSVGGQGACVGQGQQGVWPGIAPQDQWGERAAQDQGGAQEVEAEDKMSWFGYYYCYCNNNNIIWRDCDNLTLSMPIDLWLPKQITQWFTSVYWRWRRFRRRRFGARCCSWTGWSRWNPMDPRRLCQQQKWKIWLSPAMHACTAELVVIAWHLYCILQDVILHAGQCDHQAILILFIVVVELYQAAG